MFTYTKSVGHYTCRNTGSGKPLPQQIMPTQNVGVYPFALREFEIYQTSCCKAKAKRFLNIFTTNTAKIAIICHVCIMKPQELMKIPHLSVLTAGFPMSENYILFDLVQGEQMTVLYVGDECTVGEGAFVDVRIFGVGLKKGLPGCFVDELHGNALYGYGCGFGGQRHELLQERFFH